MSVEFLLVIAPTRKQNKWPIIGGWIFKMDYYSVMKRNVLKEQQHGQISKKLCSVKKARPKSTFT